MNKRRIVLSLSLLGLSCVLQAAEPRWPEVTPEARPWTRWWWPGSAVDRENLSRNLGEMARAGMGGVEITPIYGVKGAEAGYIDYLSEQWMAMLAHTESEARRLGMGIDMATGTGWPFGGPEVTIGDASSKALFRHYRIEAGQTLPEPIAVGDDRQREVALLSRVMAYPADGRRIDVTDRVSPEGILRWTAPEDGPCRIVALFVGKTFQQVKRAAPGGAGYVIDHFSREALERYLDRFDRAFAASGAPWPHSFFNDSFEAYGADWTPSLLDEFLRRRGYRLEEYFPELLADGASELSVRVIADYRETLGEMLHDNFTAVWTRWAHAHGSQTRNQAHGSPANLIDVYAAVDVPECESYGISDFDIPYLRRDSARKRNDGDPATLKLASSAAHIAGKRFTSSETLTWLTEHFRTSLSQCKPEIDQMFCAGVNRVFFHGTPYSPREAAWPGWRFYAAVNMSPTNSLWRDAPAFFEYIARTQSFLQSGAPDADFLFYLPVYDIWAAQRGGYYLAFAIHGLRDRLPELYRAAERVLELGYDFDYVSDRFLAGATVEDGLIRTGGGATYKALILPSVRRMPPATLEKIVSLARQGATVVFAGGYPSDVPGLSELNTRLAALQSLAGALPPADPAAGVRTHRFGRGRIVTGDDYAGLLARCGAKPEAFCRQFGGQYARRRHPDGCLYFFTMLRNRPVDGWVPLAADARSAVFFDPMTGCSGMARLRRRDGRAEVYMQLKPGQSVILQTFDRAVKAAPWPYFREQGEPLSPDGAWRLEFVESEPQARGRFTLPSLVSWTELGNDTLRRNSGTARYTVSFTLREPSGSDYLLSLGDVRESARIRVNGREAGTLFAPPFEARIGALLREGCNTIEIDVTNLPANRIADYDRRGVTWRIFRDANIVGVNGDGRYFGDWDPIPSGLLGPVTLRELRPLSP